MRISHKAAPIFRTRITRACIGPLSLSHSLAYIFRERENDDELKRLLRLCCSAAELPPKIERGDWVVDASVAAAAIYCCDVWAYIELCSSIVREKSEALRERIKKRERLRSTRPGNYRDETGIHEDIQRLV